MGAGREGVKEKGAVRGSAFRALVSLEQVTKLLWACFLSDPPHGGYSTHRSGSALAAGGTITTDHSWSAGSPGDRAGPAPSESFPFQMPLPHPLPAAPTPARGRPAAGGGRGPVHSSVLDVFRPKQEQGLGVPASLQRAPGRCWWVRSWGAGRCAVTGWGRGGALSTVRLCPRHPGPRGPSPRCARLWPGLGGAGSQVGLLPRPGLLAQGRGGCSQVLLPARDGCSRLGATAAPPRVAVLLQQLRPNPQSPLALPLRECIQCGVTGQHRPALPAAKPPQWWWPSSVLPSVVGQAHQAAPDGLPPAQV
nr:uncharacterized protein LOC127491387 isoform X2 [Oryctolagus cuniculus]